MGTSGTEWTPLVDVAMRDGTPREALSGFRKAARFFGVRRAGRRSLELWRRRKARGRINP